MIWHTTPGRDAEPILTAMVSLYNAERFVRPLFDDLFRQTIAPKMEILVVDACSPQNDGELVQKVMRDNPWASIRYLRTDTRETCAATTNRIIREARGTYLTMANADDRHLPDALATLVNVLEQNPEMDLAYADCAVTETENEDPLTTEAIVDFLRWPDFNAALLFDRCFVGPQPVYRKSMHERFGLYDETLLANDYEFYLRAVSRGSKFTHVPEVLGLYLRSALGIEHGNQERIWRESVEARERHWETFRRGQAARGAGAAGE